VKADHSPPSSAAVKNAELYLHSPISLHGVIKGTGSKVIISYGNINMEDVRPVDVNRDTVTFARTSGNLY
jgi:hypothetical protein